MKIDDLRKSRNITDKRGQRRLNTSRPKNNPLLLLLLTRGSWKMKIALALLLLIMGGGGALSGIFTDNLGQVYQSSHITYQQNTDSRQDDTTFVSKVLGSTEDFWTQQFQIENYGTYKEPQLVFYTDNTQTACGLGQATSGPFYCPRDESIYLDIRFYDELAQNYGAAGDFAFAYVIAHEVGHHIQKQLGTLSDYHQKQQHLSQKQANQLTVRLELQADYYAGVWARYVKDQGLLEQGDIAEAMQAAHAVGDDTLQEQAYGKIIPDTFTHGTAKQRKRWFDKGYQQGNIKGGDTFSLAYADL